MSLIGKYIKVVTYSRAKDGDYEEIVYCYGLTGRNLNLGTKYRSDNTPLTWAL